MVLLEKSTKLLEKQEISCFLFLSRKKNMIYYVLYDKNIVKHILKNIIKNEG